MTLTIILFLNGIFVLLFIALCLMLVDRARIVMHQIAIDCIEIASRWCQVQIDTTRQRAKLEVWEQYAVWRLTNSRQRLQAGNEVKQ